MTTSFDPALDLTVTRVMKAPRAAVWRAWTTPDSLEKWWLPAPARCQVAKMDLRPGGAFETLISENGGEFVPHVTACFLAVEEQARLVFTDTLKSGWRPGEQPFMTAIITLKDHPMGTDYAAVVMHRNVADRDKHEEMGFYDGWSTVTAQLAELVEREEKG
ncbi:SRPBCC family protein [Nordella sp. HKS 07]|uniref:SRPBCC family protein n=1 Tax=Nordella sp. HKS 07 TaxID=2712222 RepID=UPI0013E0EAC3|nr:SRPBCC family protein [Nordella sp. HKS 07]QIG49323.1 SRPBCC family protein [Nordella sp. HKS 07]